MVEIVGGFLLIMAVAVIVYQRIKMIRLNRRLSRYDLLNETMYDIFWIIDAETNRFVYVSPSVERMRGYTAEEIMQDTVDAALTEESKLLVRKAIAEESKKFIAGEINERSYQFNQLPQPCKDGSLVWTEVITHYFRDPITNKIMIHGVTRDITERKRLDERINYLANHDGLTGLLNHNAFFEQGDLWFWSAKNQGLSLTYIQIDLNHFKPLNDQFGHDFGDAALKKVASCLTSSFTELGSVLIGRLGGDEFSVLILDGQADQITTQCQIFHQHLKNVKELNQQSLVLSASLGCATLTDEESLQALSIRADKEMYAEKNLARLKAV